MLMLHPAYSQDFTLKGRLIDPEGSGLPSATVLLLNASDSTMVNYGMSDKDGFFEIKNISRADYLLRVSYVGHEVKQLPVELPEGDVLEMGVIRLPEKQTVLGEVIIEGERVSMTIRGDTIEYDALAFGVQPHEMVEDLLKRLPGVEIDPDGTIRAQGEQVRRVLVDGREFFGRDPQMATQNLPAEAVSKVHVFDEKSEQSRFTGIDDGERDRTVNLELKDDYKQGMFGNTTLGYGPDDKFQGHTNLNRFDANSQYSILGMGNNINQQGFSISDYVNFSGGPQSFMGGGGGMRQTGGAESTSIPVNFDGRPGTNGIMTSWAGGGNMNHSFRDKTDLNVSYFYNQLGHDLRQNIERENFLPQGNYDYFQDSSQDSDNHNHRLNMRLDHEFNEKSSLLFTFAGTSNSTESQFNSFSSNSSVEGLQNTGEQRSFSEGLNLNLQSSLLWRQRLSVPGRTISAGFDLNAGRNDRSGSLEALNSFYQDVTVVDSIFQNNYLDNLNRTFRTNLSYTEPLGNRRFLELNYRFTHNNNEADQQIFDIIDDTEITNLLLTNTYNNRYTYHRGGLNIMINRDLYNLTLGAYAQVSSLRGDVQRPDEVSNGGTSFVEIGEDYFYLLPLARFNYQFSSFRRLTVNFETSVQEPTVQQLQPIIDNRDPLNLYEGNPDLEPAYRNRLTMRFNSFNPVSSFGFFVFATADYVNDAIANSVSVDDNLVRIVRPVNTQSNLNLMGNLNMNYSLSQLKSRVMLGTRLTRMQNTNILNDEAQRITNNILSGNLRYHFRPGDHLEATFSTSMNWQVTAYQYSALEQAYLNQTHVAELSWRFLEHYRLESGFRYMIYQGRTSDFDQQIPLLEVSFSRRFLKNNKGELSLSAYNLLDKELGVTQRADANFLEQQVTNSLGRYVLLSFTYSLNRHLNVLDGVGRGGGRMRMH